MSFCQKCGVKLQEGDTFCGDCGARLEGANSNSKQTSGQNPQQQYVAMPSINTEAMSKHSKQTLAIILNMIVKPVSTVKDLIKNIDQKSTIILGIVLVLIQGLFSMWKLQQFIDTLDTNLIKLATVMSDTINSISGGLNIFSAGDLLGSSDSYDSARQLIKIPFSNAFLHGIILYIVVVGVMFLGIFVAAKLFSKVYVNSLNIIKLVILATIPSLCGELLSLLLAYFSASLGAVVLLMGIIASFAIIIMNIKEAVDIDDDKITYSLAVIFSIVILCALFAIYKFVLSDVRTIRELLINS